MHATPKDVAGLKKLAGAFSANRVGTARAMREIHQMNPKGFLDATIEVLRESPEGAGAKYLLAMLLAQPDSLERICDPEQFSPAQSVTLVQQAKALDPQVEVKLARLVAKLPFDPSSTPLKCKQLLRKDLSVRHERSDTLFHLFDPSLERSVGGIATPQAWKTLPTVPRVSVRTT